MRRYFNAAGACDPVEHYMVNINERLEAIKKMVDAGAYFTINRARQYGKTTTLTALKKYLGDAYFVVGMDFQLDMSSAKFRDENTFSVAFAKAFIENIKAFGKEIPEDMQNAIADLKDAAASNKDDMDLVELFRYLNRICQAAVKPVVLMIDEVDSATNNQVFVDFLAQLRGNYLRRKEKTTFQSVILAGVYDIKNIKRRIRADEDSKENSPWNIAADFDVEMGFSKADIAGMLREYESDNHTGMDVDMISNLLYDYTSGYPFLVSRICKLMDEKLVQNKETFPESAAVWTKKGFLEAVKLLESEKNSLFESLAGKLQDYPELREMIYVLLFQGKEISYSSMNQYVDIAMMFGFVKVVDNRVVIANRIFETVLYTMFLTEEQVQNKIYDASVTDKNQFIQNGTLDMDLVLEKFVMHFTDLYGDSDDRFVEDNGRRLFLLYLKPIINGVGNYYIEARTRDKKRTDVIVDYLGKQFIVEMKIWHGQEYNSRGEKQLADYLDYYHLDKGYLLSFNFNKKKQAGINTIMIGDKMIVEAVV